MSNDSCKTKTVNDPVNDEFALAALLWAADRTLLAWIRTSMAMIGFGVVIHQFAKYLQHEGLLPSNGQVFGIGLWVLGIIALVISSQSYFSFRGRLLRNETLDVMRQPLALYFAIGLGVLGVAGFAIFMFSLPN